MRIENIESFVIRLPFDTGDKAKEWRGRRTLDYVLLRIDTDAGISGWGDAFGYGALRATKAAVDHMIAPALIGRDARDIAGISHALQQSNHIWGRYGVTMFAISGVDIALWDIAGKAAGLPLHQLLGGKAHDTLPAYASLMKCPEPDIVAARTAAAVAEGYRHVKLHETTVPAVRAAREAAGSDVAIMIDTNCPWTPTEAAAMAARFRPFDPLWLEEPIFPPEDFAALALLQAQSGIPIAAGENACTAFEFKRMFDARAVTYAQPSVTKVGGISEFRKIAALAETAAVTLVPHSPYFGPGFLATLQLLAAMPRPSMVERFYCTPEASIVGDWIEAKDGAFRVPNGPGLGQDPSPDVIRDYRDKAA
jgi:L-alanine-DL-glutamate epimerase-like enolase superfamily enzyme